MNGSQKIKEALDILISFGMPRAQQNERSALCLLALLNLTPKKRWKDSETPLVGITPMMEFAREYYDKKYAPNTRETFRRQTMHQLVQAEIALYNPDKPNRPVNSPKVVYQIGPHALEAIKSYGKKDWGSKLKLYLSQRETLSERYAKLRKMKLVPLLLKSGQQVLLSPGKHSELIKAIIEEFAPRFVPGSVLVYAGDTGDKWGYYDEALLNKIGIEIHNHGKMPDVIIFQPAKNWLLLIESVTSHGPVDPKRHEELAELFKKATAGIIYVSAFPDKKTMNRYLDNISWETEVWVAEAPTHLIHFDGQRFLGPYGSE